MSWLIKFAGSRLAPWILLGVVLALGFAFAWTYGAGKQNGVNQERAAQAKAIAVAVEQARVEHEADLKARGWQDAREAEHARAERASLADRLTELAALPPKTLIKTVEVQNESGCHCPELSLGPGFWVRFRAAGGQRGEADPPAAGTVRNEM